MPPETTAASNGEPKLRVLIAFYSRTGSVEALAKAVADGASAEGAEVRLRRTRELVAPAVMEAVPDWSQAASRMNALYPAPSEEDAEWADAIIFGTPTRFGGATSELRAYIDSLGGVWVRGSLAGKAGSAFGSSASLHGGNESTLLTLYNTMAHLGLVIVPLGYTDPSLFHAGTPYGATSATGQPPRPPRSEDLVVARYQGSRVARIAMALKAAR
jgi:NAD(P)H dehydrogenase (quinone)